MERLEKNEDFEQQFERFSTLTLPGKEKGPESATTVKVTQITPPQDKLKDSRMLVFAQAWLHPLKDYEYTLKQLYDEGAATLTFDHPRVGGELPNLPPDELEAVREFAKIAPEEVRSAQLLLAVLGTDNKTQVNVLTHSRGLSYTALAALIDDVRAKKEGRENRIRNIVAYGPVGLIGQDSLAALAFRTQMEDRKQTNYGPDWGGEPVTMEQLAEELSNERKEKLRLGLLPEGAAIEPAAVLKEIEQKKAAAETRGLREYGPANEQEIAVAKKAAETMVAQGVAFALGKQDSGAEKRGLMTRLLRGIPRSVREAVGLSKLNMEEVLPRLREIGVGVAIARGTSDNVFPTERMAAYMKEFTKKGALDISITGVHDTMNRDPRAVRILYGAFKELERQRERSTFGTSA